MENNHLENHFGEFTALPENAEVIFSTGPENALTDFQKWRVEKALGIYPALIRLYPDPESGLIAALDAVDFIVKRVKT